MNHLKWLEHSTTLLGIQQTLFSELGTCDIKISSGGKVVAAHRFVLSAASDFFKTLLHDLPRNEEATIILPDTKQQILDNIISFIYTGETCLTSQYLSDFLDCTHSLGIKSAINFEVYDLSKNGPKRDKIVVDPAVTTTITATTSQQTESVLIEDDDDSHDQRQYADLEVYNTTETDKLGFSIGDIENTTETDASEFTLTEFGGQYNPIQQMEAAPELNINTQSVTVTPEEKCATSTPILPTSQTVQTLAESPMVAIPSTTFVTKKQKKPKGPKVIDVRHTTTLDISDNAPIENYDKNDTMEMETSKGDSLDAAVTEVISGGLSLQKAAEKYNIAKPDLWRQAKTNPNYTKNHKENLISEYTCEKLKAGYCLRKISQDLDIPMSTIHLHKVRLSNEGLLPENIAIKKRSAASKRELKEKLSKAITALLGGMSQNQACNVYKISKSTLWRHLQRRGLSHLNKKKGNKNDIDDNNVEFVKPELDDMDDDVEFAKPDPDDLDDDVEFPKPDPDDLDDDIEFVKADLGDIDDDPVEMMNPEEHDNAI